MLCYFCCQKKIDESKKEQEKIEMVEVKPIAGPVSDRHVKFREECLAKVNASNNNSIKKTVQFME